MESSLWVPEEAQIDAERDQLIEARLRDTLAEGVALERAFKQLDSRLEVAFVGERAESLYGDVIPGRWHIILRRSDGVDLYLPILGPDGKYREPSYSVVQSLKENDLWNPQVLERLMKERREHAENRTREAERQREARKDQIAEDFRAAKRVSGDGGMLSRKWGKNG